MTDQPTFTIHVHQFAQGPDEPGCRSLEIVADGLIIDGAVVSGAGPERVGDLWKSDDGLVLISHFATGVAHIYVLTADPMDTPDRVDTVPPHSSVFSWTE